MATEPIPASTDGGPYRPEPASAVQTAGAPTRPFSRPELLAVVALVGLANLGLVSQGRFYMGGFGLALCSALAPAVLFVAARRWRRSPVLVVLTVASLMASARTAVAPTPLTTLFSLGLLFAFPVALRAPRTSVVRFALGCMQLSVAWVSRAAAVVSTSRAGWRRLPIGRVPLVSIVAPAGLCLLFGGVFALANPMVSRALGRAWDALISGVWLPSVPRVMVTVFALVVSVLLVRPSVALRTFRDQAEERPARAVRLQVARNALVALSCLFFTYLAVEVVFLSGGAPPTGVTTQEYAHQGALWLTLALALQTLVTIVLLGGAPTRAPEAAGVRRLGLVWIALGALVAIGTYWRIGLHIAASGLSDLRILGVMGTTLVVAGLGLIAIMLRRGRSRSWLLRRQIDAFVLGVFLYAVTPTHWLAATVNVARVMAGEDAPLIHMPAQVAHDESVLALVPLLDHPDPVVRQGIAGLLRQRDRSLPARHWQGADVLSPRARTALDSVSPRIGAELGSADPEEAARVLVDRGLAAM